MYFSICNLLINYLSNFYHYFCILSFSSFCFKYIRYFIVPAWPLDDNWANSHKLVRNPDLGCSSALLVQLIIHFSNFYYWIIASAFENERPCSFLCTIVLDIFLQPFIYHSLDRGIRDRKVSLHSMVLWRFYSETENYIVRPHTTTTQEQVPRSLLNRATSDPRAQTNAFHLRRLLICQNALANTFWPA